VLPLEVRLEDWAVVEVEVEVDQISFTKLVAFVVDDDPSIIIVDVPMEPYSEVGLLFRQAFVEQESSRF
jgi:hypothetical protein